MKISNVKVPVLVMLSTQQTGLALLFLPADREGKASFTDRNIRKVNQEVREPTFLFSHISVAIICAVFELAASCTAHVEGEGLATSLYSTSFIGDYLGRGLEGDLGRRHACEAS
jgi:hypothetical protein